MYYPGKFDHDLTVLLKPGMMVRLGFGELSQGTALFQVCELL